MVLSRQGDLQEKNNTIHPRPQLTRTRWIDLAGAWGFAYDDERRGLEKSWQTCADVYTRTIQVPFPPEAPVSGIGDTSFHPIVWYRRTFQVPFVDAGKRLLLHCGAIDYRAHVWVNGQLVATHEGGQTPFSADITTALHEDEDQVIVIRAEDAPLDLAQPRGKQDWQEQPHNIWYHRTTGIWQPVWLEPVDPTHITQVRWTPDLDAGQLGFTATLQRQEEPLHLHIHLSLHGVTLADEIYLVQGTEVQRQIAFDRAGMMNSSTLLWSPEHPNLIEAKFTLLVGNEIVDEVQSYAGLRSVGVGHGRFLLNGRPYYLRLALEQGYWPESHLAAPTPEALHREVEVAKALGFNGVRIHQKVEDPRFLYWCDRLGLLVWGEMANAYVFSPTAAEHLVREWQEVLARDYSHPCIAVWVPLNESWGIPNVAHDPSQRHYVQALYHLTKTLDPTRPVIGNDGWEHIISDIYSIHDYAFEGTTLRERYGGAEAVERTLREVQPHHHTLALPGSQRTHEPVMLTEFGGISYSPQAGEPWHGYGTVSSSDAFLAKYSELVDAILDSPVIAGFCYTQLTDTAQETNGLLTAAREPKLDPAAICQITSRPSAAVPGDVIRQMQKEQETTSFVEDTTEIIP
ncbi:MAG TPA: glycoside hydrolase family 2 TIM barrel-domain containing protein [Ktedonobacteraceae bacterium]|nr:glycoside hydrolase family 2 TIM barrel-domain containing protein [Ktedonobacteraceae bacterium]